MERILRIDVVLDEDEIRHLAFQARGFFREDPRKKWSSEEFRQAARLAGQQLVTEYLNGRRALGLLPQKSEGK